MTMNTRNVTWMKDMMSKVNIATAYDATAAVIPTIRVPSRESSSFAARPIRRTNLMNSHASAAAPTMPVSSRIPSHWSSRMGAFAFGTERSGTVMRVPKPSPKSGFGLNYVSNAGPNVESLPAPTGASWDLVTSCLCENCLRNWPSVPGRAKCTPTRSGSTISGA